MLYSTKRFGQQLTMFSGLDDDDDDFSLGKPIKSAFRSVKLAPSAQNTN